MHQTDLSTYNKSPYHPGATAVKRILWFCVNSLFFKTSLFPITWLKVWLLRLFGAEIGKSLVIRTCINIKYPWLLRIGDHSWIGEEVWIDNLVMINIGKNVCLSQGAILLTGSHNYKSKGFDLITGTITLEDGVWIGAGAMVNHSITVSSHAVLTTGSVATKDMEPYFIYQGNPAQKIRPRLINS